MHNRADMSEVTTSLLSPLLNLPHVSVRRSFAITTIWQILSLFNQTTFPLLTPPQPRYSPPTAPLHTGNRWTRFHFGLQRFVRCPPLHLLFTSSSLPVSSHFLTFSWFWIQKQWGEKRSAFFKAIIRHCTGCKDFQVISVVKSLVGSMHRKLLILVRIWLWSFKVMQKLWFLGNLHLSWCFSVSYHCVDLSRSGGLWLDPYGSMLL